jgi:AhpD family alkylhydroperoxidase
MQARMKNPAMVISDAGKAIYRLMQATKQGGVPQTTLELVHLRASQINGCSACVDSGSKGAHKAGVSDDQLFAVAAWRETPYFNDAERAALALAESATRLADGGGVPDDVWDEAAKHYDEQGLAAVLLMIATTNLFNRLNATTRQPAGEHWG